MIDVHTILELLDSDAAVPADGILSRTVYTDEQIKVVWFGFAAGQELSEHTASQPAMVHILQGEARLQLGGETHAARAGTWVHMPADLPHGIFAKTPLIMLLILLKGR